ncbi:MAG TPA: amidase family protein [Ilumatobacteraceae bacterium]|nr:amidase family protein [Ilumatobacteraceae bacterium]
MTGGSDPTVWSAGEQAAAIRSRRLSSEELLDLFLARIAAVDPQVNAVCTLAVDPARERCREADAATINGQSWGPLHGLPITIKDAIATAGIRSTGGATALRDHVPVTDAPAVASLKAAGAIVFGKTNLPEWSGDWQSFNEMFGTTNNPWDLARTPGGSSGGAAAAVACGMTSFELGTDIGGSVRVPSAFCGVWGHKPSFGIIPTLGYLDEPAGGGTESDVNTFGPLARSALDLRLLLDVLAQPTAERAAAWQLHLPEPTVASPRALRVAAWFDEPRLEIDADMAAVLHDAADALQGAGAVVDRSARPAIDVDSAWRLGARLIGAAVSVSDDGDHDGGGGGLSHRDWLLMHRQQARLRVAWADLFRGFDVLLCPVTLSPAFEHAQQGQWNTREIFVNGRQRSYVELEGWPALIGAAYLPSTSAPVGRTRAGLPVGVQVVAPFLCDRTAIQVAQWLATLVGGYSVPPICS